MAEVCSHLSSATSCCPETALTVPRRWAEAHRNPEPVRCHGTSELTRINRARGLGARATSGVNSGPEGGSSEGCPHASPRPGARAPHALHAPHTRGQAGAGYPTSHAPHPRYKKPDCTRADMFSHHIETVLA